MNWSTGTTNTRISNLTEFIPVYFNVIVRDESGNTAVYLSSPLHTAPTLIAGTSFEECPTPTTNWYKDFGKPLQDHYLTNNPADQTNPTNNIVHWEQTGTEIGFRTFYKMRNGIGITEGDKFGVNSNTFSTVSGKWITIEANLSGSYTCAQLVVMGSNNQDDEISFVDHIRFYGY